MTDAAPASPDNPHLATDRYRAILRDLVATLPEEGHCEVCGESEETVEWTYCEELPLLQMCDHCHPQVCPEGGNCV